MEQQSIPGTISKETFLDKLRRKTSAAHIALEALPVSVSIVNPKVTREEYRLYLELMYPLVNDLELNVFPVINNEIDDLEERRKEHLIANDLEFLGSSNKNLVDMPFTHVAKEYSTAFAMGIMYVMEGSALGGRVILKNIMPALNLSEEEGCQYFAGYKNRTGPYWKKFLDILTSYEAQHNAEAEMIAGANFAFITIHNFLATKPG
jgi:heme oxygenase (biliverdin-IX-beta and delta-forming)